MTALDIKTAAEAYIDETMDSSEAIAAINRAMGIIGDMALVTAQTSITAATDNSWVSLPDNLTNVLDVIDSDGNPYLAYRQFGNQIFLTDAGTYTLWYRRLPNPIQVLSDTPEIHVAYHPALVTYVIAWWKLKDDDENPDGVRREQEFYDEVQRIYNSLERRRVPRSARVVRGAGR